MSIFTKAMTATAFAAVMAISAGAAPVKRVPHTGDEGTIRPSKVIPADPSSETWHDIGTGTLRDDVMTYLYIVDPLEFPVRIQESDQQEGRYRLVNGWANYPLLDYLYANEVSWPADKEVYVVIDATDPDHVFIEEGYMGCYTGPAAMGEGFQQGVLWSMAGDYFVDNLNQFSPDELDRIAGTLRDGAITFPQAAVLFQPEEPSQIVDGKPQRTLWIQVNQSGKFRVKLPGAPDVDVDMTFLGATADQKGLDYELALQDDIDKLRVALVEGDDIETIVEQIKNGEIEYMEITGDGRYTFPYTGDGRFSLVAVPYTEDGVARYESVLTHPIQISEDEWKKMGMAKYTESIISDNEMRDWGFRLSGDTHEVAVEMNVKEPQIFRLVNAYGPPYIHATSTNYDDTRNYYIEFDARDANRVVMRQTEDFIGINLGYRDMRIWSKADRLIEQEGLTLDEINEWEKENGPVFGWIDDDNVLRFPKNSLLLNFSAIRPDTWYWANREGNFRLELPKEMKFLSGVESVDGYDSEAPVEYYTLDGMKVSGENLAPGIYVVRQGSKVWKQTVK